MFYVNGKNSRLDPILKWPGGKQDELQRILPSMPTDFSRYYEPFLGGGAVYLSIPTEIQALVNDKSEDLIRLYRSIATQDDKFFSTIEFLLKYWKLIEIVLETDFGQLLRNKAAQSGMGITDFSIREQIDSFLARHKNELIYSLEEPLDVEEGRLWETLRQSLYDKLKRMNRLEKQKGLLSEVDFKDNVEAALKAGFYYYVRYIYNNASKLQLETGQRDAVFFFIRENAYAAMFRFNARGEFNIPYGGISYNRKNLNAKVERLRDPVLSARLKNTIFCSLDFADFMALYPPTAADFVFLDPPYDSEFSSYDKNHFGVEDQERLADYLINTCPARFMLVIKSSPLIRSLYTDKGLKIENFDKKYMYTIKERNNRDAVHLLITNY